MKVMFLLSSSRYSGAENVVCQIISMFKNDPDTELIYCSPDGEIREALAERGVTFFPITDITVPEVKRAIRELCPDVIHAHDMRASYIAARACKKIPLISHIHNNAFDARKISPKSVAYLYAGHKAKHIFWVSESSYQGYIFHKRFKKKSEILYNIIDVDALYRKMESDEKTYDYDVVYLGRLTYQKHPERVLDLMKTVLEKRPETKIALIGTGDLADFAREYAKEIGIDTKVDFLGFVSNPLKILRSAKVMMMASRWEGTPMCALESLALGVPIVSTPADGLEEVVKDGKNGYLSEDDTVLVDRILELVTNEALHNEFSTYAAEEARRFNDVAPYKQSIADAYAKAIAK